MPSRAASPSRHLVAASDGLPRGGRGLLARRVLGSRSAPRVALDRRRHPSADGTAPDPRGERRRSLRSLERPRLHEPRGSPTAIDREAPHDAPVDEQFVCAVPPIPDDAEINTARSSRIAARDSRPCAYPASRQTAAPPSPRSRSLQFRVLRHRSPLAVGNGPPGCAAHWNVCIAGETEFRAHIGHICARNGPEKRNPGWPPLRVTTRDCFLMRKRGLEPPRPFDRWNLNPVRLPIPPLPRGAARGTVRRCRCQGGRKGVRNRFVPLQRLRGGRLGEGLVLRLISRV